MATDPTTDTQPLAVATPSRPEEWVTVAAPGVQPGAEAPVPVRRVLGQVVAGTLVVLLAVTVGGSFAARRLAEREAVTDAAATADVLAEAVVQPVLTDAVVAGDPTALAELDATVRDRVLGPGIVHVKLWRPDGTVVYADEAALVGRRFELDADQEEAIRDPQTRAEISSLDRDENELDRAAGDKLVEVYRPVWTPGGETMLFEIYAPYDDVVKRTGAIWRGFTGVTLSSLLLFLVLLVPLLAHLLRRVRRDQRQREVLLLRAVDASATERRRIAASLHDGPVQDLAATSFVVSAAAARARSEGRYGLGDELQDAAGSVRASMRALRSLLVDIYPPSLAQAGLGAALADLVQSTHVPGLEVHLHADPDERLALSPDQERLVFRVTQETLRNAGKHAVPCTVTVTLFRVDDEVVLDVVDDGTGFDVRAGLAASDPGHLGLRLLADLADEGGGLLQVTSAPGHGTHWRLQL